MIMITDLRKGRWLLMLAVFMTLLTACKKEEQIVISGRIADPNMGIPVAGVRVEIWTQHIESGIFVANFTLDGSILTGTDGRFSFSLGSKSYTDIKLIFSREGYFGWESPLNMESVKKNHGIDADFEMIPKATIEIHVLNSEPFDNKDYFEFRILNAFTTCEECCKGEKYQFFGEPIDQVLTCISAGHQDLIIQGLKRKNGEEIVINQSIFLKEFETTVIHLNY
ncbi:MAG: hypothetical protein A2X22_04285 [Bacteroidetes bacterium GWF2_49_14]|nr:MAG: hypothetical protein A2X22_04285 [Bacteroidetes bacterium GWF2_49_14]HBB90519.1 hypothetical protein [Bacteroidales bacterium]